MDDNRTTLLEGFVPANKRAWYPYAFPNLKSLTPAERAKVRKEIRKYCEEDFFFFCEVIMRDPDDLILHVGLHDELCHNLQSGADVLNLLPRNHLKSTIGAIAYPIWVLANNPNHRIVIATDVLKLAKKFLSAIQNHILYNKRLRWVYPDLRPKTKDGLQQYENWNSEEITIIRPKVGMKEPSIMVGSTEQAMTGVHCEVIVFDDVVTKKNTRKEGSLERIEDWHQDIMNLLDMKSRVIYNGTRYVYGDLYAKLIKDPETMVYRRQATEDGKHIWDAPENIARVERFRKMLSPYNWSCQYMNEPIMKGDAEFEAEWLENNRYTIEDVRAMMDNPPDDEEELRQKWYSTLNIYMGCDPARTDKKSSDYTVIMVAGFDKRGHMYPLDYIRKHYKTHEIVDKFLEMFKKWHPITAKIETYGGDVHVYNNIIKVMKENGDVTNRVQQYIRTAHMTGDDRIRSLEKPVHDGMLHFPGEPLWDKVVTEFLHFPFGEHDDCATVVSYLWRQGKKKKEKKERVREYGWRSRQSRSQRNTTWLAV